MNNKIKVALPGIVRDKDGNVLFDDYFKGADITRKRYNKVINDPETSTEDRAMLKSMFTEKDWKHVLKMREVIGNDDHA